ncbi:CCA tRNA nucleotidyltransferase [Caloramator australicus]|uniref:tRNA nucleotidyltransferase, CC-adding n=1 Tax=Caloramator australicus RC3 TaxID=857293 RepID=G0V4C0_9CLOT|nr:HD domain-containing protein [Caloramator australicus]CCC57960.1 tRNA nucleotidyltransferase, CC-adding [Caloramator australicus RC3]
MDIIKEICVFFKGKDVKAFLVGGAVRDIILGYKLSDIDIAVDKDFLSLAEEFSQEKGGHVFLMHEDVARVIIGDFTIDFCRMKGETIEEDLKKRDFTINAIAKGLKDDKIIDILGGIKDLKDGIIKVVYPDALLDDPLRMLRAFRLKGKLNFKIEENTLNLIKKNYKRINEVSGERIRDEIFKILDGEKSYEILRELDEVSLLSEIFPVVKRMKLVGKCKYHTVDSFTHSMFSLKTFEDMIDNVLKTKHGEDIKRHLEEDMSGVKRKTVLKLATLLHDIGKPKAYKKEGEKITFKGHDVTGYEEFQDIDKRYNFSKEQRSLITAVIKGHMRILGLFKVGATDRALYRLIRDFENNTLDVILASLFDVTATRLLLDESGERERYFNFCMELIDRLYKKKELPKKLVSGEDVIRLTGKKGRFVGEVLDALHEEVFLGNIRTREEAIDFIKNNYAK